MNAITAVPWHVYVTMFVFAVTIGLLAVFELHDLRRGGSAAPRRPGVRVSHVPQRHSSVPLG